MTHYIGYGSLEAWAAVTMNALPVFALCGYTARRTARGMPGVTDIFVTVAQVSPVNGDVNYLRFRLGTYNSIPGSSNRPMFPQDREIIDNAQAGFELVRTWLVEQGYQVREAAVAMPLHLRHIDGNID